MFPPGGSRSAQSTNKRTSPWKRHIRGIPPLTSHETEEAKCGLASSRFGQAAGQELMRSSEWLRICEAGARGRRSRCIFRESDEMNAREDWDRRRWRATFSSRIGEPWTMLDRGA
ncbi:hypothetical protein NL676_026738 [Syzygium grande]|nr:hypothetical protein NL676_026738 [Syzygium grande]